MKSLLKNRIKPEKLEEAKFMVKEYLDYRKDVNDILETRNLKLPLLPKHVKRKQKKYLENTSNCLVFVLII